MIVCTAFLSYNTIPTYLESVPAFDEASLQYLLQNFEEDFQQVIRREFELFEILMDLFSRENKFDGSIFFSKNWREKSSYDVEDENYVIPDTRSIEDRISDSYILCTFLTDNQIDIFNIEEVISFLEPVKSYLELKDNWNIYTDIYGQDMYNFKYNTRRPIVLTRNGKYLAHIWNMGLSVYPGFISQSHIGIRDSWENKLNKIYKTGLEYNGVAVAVLTGCREVYRILYGMSVPFEIMLDAPIGPMRRIAQNYGFKYGETMMLSDKPKVPVPEVEVHIL